MNRGLSFARRLHRLKKVQNSSNDLDVSSIEADFISLSNRSSNKVLKVKLPNLYVPEKDEMNHLGEVFQKYNIPIDAFGGGIDISGGFDNNHLDMMIFLSPAQLRSEHFNVQRSYLNPLIEEIYSRGTLLLRDFTIFNALCGSVKAYREDIDLEDITFCKERFKPGPYELKITLDSPGSEVSNFMRLKSQIENMKKNPKQSLLSPEILKLVEDAVSLRQKFGALSRYQRSGLEFKVKSNSYISRSDKHKYFFLFEPNSHKNFLVYFGEAPFDENSFIPNIEIYRGCEYQETLKKLIKHGFYKPSEAILEQRLSILKDILNNKANGYVSSGIEELVSGLESAKQYFKRVMNQEMRTDYIMSNDAKLLEFVSYPTQEDPIVHELLPMLSWNRSLRIYYHTNGFERAFSNADTKGRQKLLNSVLSSILFDNQQNNDVNVWLYMNYKEIVEKTGIEFDVC